MGPRQSTRLKAKAAPKSPTNVHATIKEGISGFGPDYEEESEPPAKRRKRQPTKSKARKDVSQEGRPMKKQAALQKLPEMPLDILHEIFGHCKPLDLLHLSRTTKALRNLLMSRSAAFIWQQSLADVEGLPERPPELNEPQFIRLMFDTHCQYCSARGATTAQWKVRIRCCTRCFKANFVNGRNLLWRRDHVNGRALSYATGLHRKYGLALHHLVASESRSGVKPGCYYLKPDIHRFIDRLEDVLEDRSRLREFVKERDDIVSEAQKFDTRCYLWNKKAMADRSSELDEIRVRRKNTILAKLQKLGWGEEIDKMSESDVDALFSRPSINQARDLTDRAWNSLKDDLILELEELQDNRLEREQREHKSGSSTKVYLVPPVKRSQY